MRQERPAVPAGHGCGDDLAVHDQFERLSPEPFEAILREGSALVIDDAEAADVGSIGSFNILAWKLKGMVGVVTDASARDLDEIETEGVPLYLRRPGRGIRPGRNELESVNRPIVCGGVLVMPGDVVAADGDGVIAPFAGETAIFITPGHRFRAVDLLMTNFHLPRSTLFMLVAAFSGLEVMRRAYAHAIAAGYRFYSYGDACLLFPRPSHD